MICRHCRRRPANRSRGLCWTCYYRPGVRERYPCRAKQCATAIREPPPPAEPTTALPGTPEKVRVLEERAGRGEGLWHGGDA